jgi:flagellar hook-length control protein FliK
MEYFLLCLTTLTKGRILSAHQGSLMIVQSKETKSQKSLIDLLGGNTKNSSSAKSNDLFSKLLSSMGMQTKGDDLKVVKANDFKAIIDPKKNEIKSIDSKPTQLKEELMNLLSGKENQDLPFISKELVQTLSAPQLKTLIHEAKENLKKEITAKNPDLALKEESLPKTLAGLVKLAEKLGLDPTAATLTTIVQDSAEKESFPIEMLTKPLLDTKAIAALPATYQEESPIEAITQLLSELKRKEAKETKTPLSTESTQNSNSTEEVESQPLKALLQTIEKREPETTTGTANASDTVKFAENVTASAPVKTDGLIALLQGEHKTKESPSSTTESTKIEVDSSKTAHTPKVDSIEVKSKEAQQSMRLFASDLKEAVQEYKPPFTRLTMKLNPEKLGEVEVTLVQRGNNVHVNIQSTNANSVAFLAHNATELKAQLAHQGITNATMNFMSGGENQQQSNAQQQQHQQEQRQNAFRSYESFEELTLNEEQLSALEIIIPHYA